MIRRDWFPGDTRPAIQRWFDWITDLPLRAELWLLDRIAGPLPETEADRIREMRKDRLRRAFPDIDVDGMGPRSGRRR